MNVIKGFLWLLGFLLLGDLLVTWLQLPISAGVVGMLLLTAWLILRGRLHTDIAAVSQPLIALLAMLIMPGVVGVFFVLGDYAHFWLAAVLALVVGTLLSVLTTLWLMSRMMPRQPPRESDDD
ncbi:MAG: CidA/LrgA family protein [Nitrincola lacisaponensis]|uniref:Antiholin-like protein LrgA n=1 Tax=Nitrincola lacisaponensis TaxID=267850 RepID=A0A063Y4Y6_9GAMM|nr:CidA/LrgA family protein [Nitrincola lacisaponensis]KDE41383.1 Antiholin-like protein LrgA [Nitrincola lacisaponensis]